MEDDPVNKKSNDQIFHGTSFKLFKLLRCFFYRKWLNFFWQFDLKVHPTRFIESIKQTAPIEWSWVQWKLLFYSEDCLHSPRPQFFDGYDHVNNGMKSKTLKFKEPNYSNKSLIATRFYEIIVSSDAVLKRHIFELSYF